MKTKQVFDASVYPVDGEYVIYYFEPFETWHVGKFVLNADEEDDEITKICYPMVFGHSGFTTWHPEVTMWMKSGKEE